MKCPDPEWYVYCENFNGKTIEKFNVFHSYNFLNGCKKAFKKYSKDIEKLKEEIRTWAMYSFWSKSEYEVIITAWPPMPEEWNFKDIKIDIYDQLMLNWDSFVQYTLDHKAFFLRRTKE